MQIKASKLDMSRARSRIVGLVKRALPLRERQNILAKALEPVAEVMRANAPRDSGKSAETIGVEILEGTGNAARVAVGVGTKGFPLFFNEYGTEDQPARPAIRPAWESTAADVSDQVAKAAADAIKEAV